MSSNKKKNNLLSQSKSFQSKSLTLTLSTDDDDDFQNPNPTPTQSIRSSLKPHTKISTSQPLKPFNNVPRFKKPKLSISTGKENVAESSSVGAIDLDSFDDVVCSQFDSNTNTVSDENYVFSSIGLQTPESAFDSSYKSDDDDCLTEKSECKSKKRYVSNSIESRLLAARMYDNLDDVGFDEASYVDFEPGTQLDDLIKLCEDGGEDDFPDGNGSVDGLVECPLCGSDISSLSEELRHAHTNDCLDKDEVQKTDPPGDDNRPKSPQRGTDISPVLDWLRGLGLSKYEDAFVKEEVDWDTLQWLTEEDLFSIGVTTLGPRKKMIHALNELRKGNAHADHGYAGSSKVSSDETKRIPGNKLITEFFPGSSVEKNRNHTNQNKDNNRNGPNSVVAHGSENKVRGSAPKKETSRNYMRKGKSKDIPLWCCIPGTPFRVDAFRCLRGDCSHWFLTHFHTDHYQGLSRSFCHGKVYCSLITARLVNMKIGIPWDKLEVLPLNQKVSIAGIDVTCLDANHCPGAIIILFEPPNGKAVLHTGDFRFREEMVKIPTLQSCAVQTLILDTTYCNPQYDFPKQEAIIQFVIEAIQAEAFNPKTLFLIGSYTIGKERLFLEVARCLQKKVYVGAAKMHTIRCLELPEEDMKWFTSNEQESHIHVVPLWTIASFKRMKHISNQYLGRFSTIVAFSPTGWTYGKGKKKSQGRRWQQGTIIRYEVPYSEHSSFTELKEFVEFISPENIIPSVNNDGPESVEAMIAMLKC